jgi:hypothetical protein
MVQRAGHLSQLEPLDTNVWVHCASMRRGAVLAAAAAELGSSATPELSPLGQQDKRTVSHLRW